MPTDTAQQVEDECGSEVSHGCHGWEGGTAQQVPYAGPAGPIFSPEEILVIWRDLTRLARFENASIREKCQAFLERRNSA